jgi:hypothetical protein
VETDNDGAIGFLVHKAVGAGAEGCVLDYDKIVG